MGTTCLEAHQSPPRTIWRLTFVDSAKTTHLVTGLIKEKMSKHVLFAHFVSLVLLQFIQESLPGHLVPAVPLPGDALILLLSYAYLFA